jgi:hypothetical protein
MTRKIIGNSNEGVVIALCLAALTPFSTMSFVVPRASFVPRSSFQGIRPCRSFDRRHPVRLQMNLNSDDPFQVLGIDEPTADKKVIKRAYKRMALKYHPDVLYTKDSTPEEKKKANDRFAKINWAYSTLSGKLKDDNTYKSKSTSATRDSSSSTGGWTPPHRRSGQSYSSQRSDTGSPVNWDDFMPKSEKNYDTDGDSFGKIFSDLFTTAASSGGSGVFKDFIDFLEGNVDGYGGPGVNDDAELRILLNTGSKSDIRNELDDTELVVNQLKTKLNGINNDISSVAAEMDMTTRYLEKMGLEESLAELNARKNVVAGYLKKAQKRLLTLQMRYQEIMSQNNYDSDDTPRGRQTTWKDIKRGSTSSASSSTASSTSTSGNQGTTSGDKDSWRNEGFGSSSRGGGRGSRRRQSSTASQRDSKNNSAAPTEQAGSYNTGKTEAEKDNKDSWMNEGFGSTSSGRGRGSTRNGTGAQPGNTSQRESVYSSNSGASFSRDTSKTNVSPRNPTSTDVPPHRRTSSYSGQNEDKKRLQEIKVDEEFEKLKKELGL